jgi:hypothetical protein
VINHKSIASQEGTAEEHKIQARTWKHKANTPSTHSTTQILDSYISMSRVSARSEYTGKFTMVWRSAVAAKPVLVLSCEVGNNALCLQSAGMWRHDRRNAPRIWPQDQNLGHCPLRMRIGCWQNQPTGVWRCSCWSGDLFREV